MGKYLTLEKGGNAQSCDTISQKLMNQVAEQGLEVFQKGDDGRYYKMRVAAEPNVDPRTGKSYVLDNWVPVAGLPQELENEAKKSNEEDNRVRLREPSGDRPRGMTRQSHNLGTMTDVDITDPNFRNSVQAKELAAGVGAGNLALKDPRTQRHDGLPAPDDKRQPNQSVADQPPAQQARDNAEREARSSAPATEQSKPAAPSPQGQPPVRGSQPFPQVPGRKE